MKPNRPGPSDRYRRRFIKGIGAATAGVFLPSSLSASESPAAAGDAAETGSVPRRVLGRTGEKLSIMGMGGHTLALASAEQESIRMVHEAVDAGINFMDNAWDYNRGRSEEIMGKGLAGRRDRVFLMTKVCAHIRGQTRQAAMEMLEESLTRLQTDHLDLWMLHELSSMEQVDAAFADGGPLEGLLEAKAQGKVRYIGFTGHTSAEIHLAMLKHDFPFDAVLMPVNAIESNRTAFRTEVLPALQERGIGILGMKGLGGTPARILRSGRYTAKQLLEFSLSHPITAQVVGMRSVEDVRNNLEIARGFQPMPQADMDALAARIARDEDARQYAQYRHPGYRDGHGIVA